jgi:hypothetical protein
MTQSLTPREAWNRSFWSHSGVFFCDVKEAWHERHIRLKELLYELIETWPRELVALVLGYEEYLPAFQCFQDVPSYFYQLASLIPENVPNGVAFCCDPRVHQSAGTFVELIEKTTRKRHYWGDCLVRIPRSDRLFIRLGDEDCRLFRRGLDDFAQLFMLIQGQTWYEHKREDGTKVATLYDPVAKSQLIPTVLLCIDPETWHKMMFEMDRDLKEFTVHPLHRDYSAVDCLKKLGLKYSIEQEKGVHR